MGLEDLVAGLTVRSNFHKVLCGAVSVGIGVRFLMNSIWLSFH